MVKAVIFDFDGTLVDFQNTDIECLTRLLERTGADVDADSFVHRAVEHIIRFHSLVESGGIDPLTLHNYRLSRTFQDFSIPWNDSFVDVYGEMLVEGTSPRPGMERILESLSEKVKLGILTNAYDPVLQMKRIQASGLRNYFDVIQISGEEEHAKPDPEAFRTMAYRLGCVPGECVFTGDSVKYDIEGALAAGMQAVQIQGTFAETQGPSARSIEEVELMLTEMIQAW